MNTPVVSFGLDTNICSGDSVVLDMTSSNGMIYQWYVNGLANNADTLPTYTVTTNAQYVGASIIYSVNNHFCFGADTILVYTWPTPTVTISDNTVCSNTLPFLIDAGIPTPATYLWSNGATSSSINVNAGGTYSVTVTGFPSCVVEDSMILTVLQSPTATLPPAVTQCANIPLQPLDPGFPGALSYAWTDQNNQPLASTQTFTPPATVGTNTYTVVVSNGTCSATAQTVVTLNAIPVVNATSPDSICELDPPATLSANYPPGSNISYFWSTGAVTETISTSTANTYTVTVTENGCSASDVVSLSVQQQLTAPILACGVAASGSFKIVYTWSDVPGNTGYEVSPDGINWGPANNVSGATSHGTNTISPYFYVRALMNGTACDYGKTSEPVACAVIIPSIVTPNGDGQNDAFLIDNIGFYPDNTFKIFNRWGKEVYSEGGYNNTTKVFTGNDLPEGTYFYILDLGNGGDPASGTLTISK